MYIHLSYVINPISMLVTKVRKKINNNKNSQRDLLLLYHLWIHLLYNKITSKTIWFLFIYSTSNIYIVFIHGNTPMLTLLLYLFHYIFILAIRRCQYCKIWLILRHRQCSLNSVWISYKPRSLAYFIIFLNILAMSKDEKLYTLLQI